MALTYQMVEPDHLDKLVRQVVNEKQKILEKAKQKASYGMVKNNQDSYQKRQLEMFDQARNIEIPASIEMLQKWHNKKKETPEVSIDKTVWSDGRIKITKKSNGKTNIN